MATDNDNNTSSPSSSATKTSTAKAPSIDVDKLDIKLIHQIMLTHPTDSSNLNKANHHTLSFDEFQQELTQKQNVTFTIKQAFCDQLIQTCLQQQQQSSSSSVLPLRSLLLELHSAMRALVPNRTDLHSKLDDNAIITHTTNNNNQLLQSLTQILQLLIHAATALSHYLESPSRAETTIQWISIAQQNIYQQNIYQQSSSSTSLLLKEQLIFVIHSTMYLLHKTELCEQDKQDFYITSVIAPRLIQTGKGIELERQRFKQTFGIELPITKKWINELVSDATNNHDKNDNNTNDDGGSTIDIQSELRSSLDVRRQLIRKGWIQSILFQTKKQVLLPEILSLDLNLLQSIRHTTRLAAAGCALGMIACTTAGCDTQQVLQDEYIGQPLVQALSTLQPNPNHNDNLNGISSETYESQVQSAVISLTTQLMTSRTNSATCTNNNNNNVTIDEESLKGRTVAVLQGTDPLLKLLTQRIQSGFVEVMENVSFLQSGVGHNANNNNNNNNNVVGRSNQLGSRQDRFVQNAKSAFGSKGLAFYGTALAKASYDALRAIDLAWMLYHEEYLNDMIHQAIQNNDQQQQQGQIN